MSWEDQGRQSHGWFGTGTAAEGDEEDDSAASSLFEPRNAADRIAFATASIIGHVPRSDRGRWSSALAGVRDDSLRAAILVAYASPALSRDAFQSKFLAPYTSDAITDRFRSAASAIIDARSYDDLKVAGEDLADAAQGVGVDGWPRFVGDVGNRATQAVSDGQVPGIVKVAADAPAIGVGFAAVVIGGALWWLSGGSRPQQPGASVPQLAPAQPGDIFHTRPPRDAKDPLGAKAPGKPGREDGFEDPKGGEKWSPNPNGQGWGWEDKRGHVWVPSGPPNRSRGISHGGSHWDEEIPGGDYRNVFPKK